MMKRGPKPKGKVLIEWSPAFAYAIGLLVTDGSLSKNGRHIVMASRDREQLLNYMHALSISAKIGKVISGSTGRITLRVQIGDVLFYQFLISIGLSPNKSMTLSAIKVPREYYFDFLRGHLDGDGSIHTYKDTRWRSSTVVVTSFVSASEHHIEWLRKTNSVYAGVYGHISRAEGKILFQLRYGKRESAVLWKKMYNRTNCIALSRKRLKIEKITRIIRTSLAKDKNDAQVVKLADTLP